MANRTTKSLYLQIEGNVDGLRTATKAGRSALLSMADAASDVQAEVARSFAAMADSPQAAAQALERSYTATFNKIRESARTVLNAPDNASALKLFDAAAAEQQLQISEAQAVAFRQTATAAENLAAKGGELADEYRTIAFAAAASAEQAERETAVFRKQAAAADGLADELMTMGVAHNRASTMSGQHKQSMMMLGQQVQDFSVQVVSGQSVVVAFAQQIGQAAFALQGMGGKLSGVANFLGGFWGIAATTALTVLVPLVSKITETGEAAGDADEATRELAHTVDDIGSFFDRTTGKIKDTNRALIEYAVLSRQKKSDDLRESMINNAKTGQSLRNDSMRNLKPVMVERGLGREAPRTVNFDVDEALKLPYAQANAALRSIARSNSTNAKQAADLLAERAKFAKSMLEINRNNDEIRSLQSGSLAASLRTDTGGRGGRGSGERGGTRRSSRALSDQAAGRAVNDVQFDLSPPNLDPILDPAQRAARLRQQAQQFSDEVKAIFGDADPMADIINEYNAGIQEEINNAEAALQDRADGPIDQYKDELKKRVGDTGKALEQVGVNAFHSFSDGLVGIISGTEDVSSAFKRMTQSILADLARIAVEKAIVAGLEQIIPGASAFLGKSKKAGGGKIEGKASGGRIVGPGTGKSDSIFALVDGTKPLLVSNGESIVTAEATSRWWPIIEAMNNGSFSIPGLAAGGPIGNVRMPRLPDVRAAQRDLAAAGEQRIAVDVSARVDASPEFEVKMQGVAARTVGAAAEPIMAGSEARTIRTLRRPSLPGAPG